MPINFNVDPYYDDFDQTKNFHRILFRPGRAVQARELTQSQTIIQDQITKFADNIFKQNSPVTGGNVTTNFNNHYVKLLDTYNDVAVDVTQWEGLLVKNDNGTVIARVVGVSVGTESESPTLVLSYRTGTHFTDGDVIYDTVSNLATQAIATDATGSASTASISQGVFYILGHFVQIQDTTIILDKYDNSPSKRIGLYITETIQDYIDDSSILDRAVGASNYQAPGADRYVISIELQARPLEFGDDQWFVELVRVTNGEVSKLVDGSVYNVIDDYFAKRDYETNGDYVVQDFKLTTRTADDPDQYTLSVGKGLAYVHGYRTESTTQVDLTSNRARTTSTQADAPIYVNFGSYFYVDYIRGYNGQSFDTTTTQAIDLHSVSVADIDTTNTSTYYSTTVGTGYIRGLTYDFSSNDSDANTYVHKAFVYDIEPKTLSGTARSGNTLTTIKLPSGAEFSSVDDAYIGVNITITGGTSVGDFRTITAYNGTTKVATVNANFTVIPDNTSTFNLAFAIKDTEVLVAKTGSGPYSLSATANINTTGRVNGLATGDTYLENINVPEMIFKIGNPFVANNTGAHYTAQYMFRNTNFTSSGSANVAELTLASSALQFIGTGELSDSAVQEMFTIVVTDKKTNTTIKNGDILTWNKADGRTITANTSFVSIKSTDLDPFDATIYAKVYVANGESSVVLKSKALITATTSSVSDDSSGYMTNVNTNTYVDNTTGTSKGHVYIKNAGLVSPGSAQSLYLSDVKRIVKIIDTKTDTVPTLGMLTSASNDVTDNYIFDNGQRDSYYDHATLTLKPGAPQPSGNLLVLVDYYQHTGGDGYFSITSYSGENYNEIPSYTAKNGESYDLRDCIDFRPARKNATTSFVFRVSTGDTYTGYQGLSLPLDGQLFTTDYSYYLGRKDKLVLTKDRKFQIVEGAPSLNPIFPAEPDGALVLANITHNPYTGYIPTEAPSGVVSDLSVEKVKHKRYTMQDIANIENRIEDIEYYTSLSLLEQSASGLQITDAYGLNRFKNGIMTEDFSSFAAADSLSGDFALNISTREQVGTAPQIVTNYPLKASTLVSNGGNLSDAAKASIGYSINSDGNINYFSLPYTTSNAATQKFATRTVNVNPFSFSTREGALSISPNVDTWVDTNYSPKQLVIDPTLSLYTASDKEQYMYSDYKTIPGVVAVKRDKTVTRKTSKRKKVDVYEKQEETMYSGYYSKSTALNNNYITDVSILPFMRSQQIVVRGRDMLHNATINSYFDGTNVDKYVRKCNIIELNSVSGEFKENDVIGYYSSGTFYAQGRIVGVHKYSTTTTVRLYVAADGTSTKYTVTGAVNGSETLQNGQYNSSGGYTTTTASGKVTSVSHYGATIAEAKSTTLIKLAGTAPASNNYYGVSSNTFYVNSGTGAGQSAVISAYYSANQTLALATSVTAANGDIYSIGTMKTDETGSFYGIFNLPSNTFHNGQRTLRLDNSNGVKGSETTYSEATFFAQGLQTTALQQTMSSSPDSVSDIWVSGSKVNEVVTSSYWSKWDPVAQTFMVSKDNYPNGLFLDSITVFFKSKPTTDTASISLSIVETLNGYPTSTTIDNSVVTLQPQDVKTSSEPQFITEGTRTTFKFKAPVYVQPETLYAFILKSRSNEYILHTAMAGDTALESSTKNTPTGVVNKTKLSGAPYVGGLFTSQNSQTWTVDQNQALMFVIDRCVFSTGSQSVNFVVPKKLPQRTLIDQSVQHYLNANSISSSIDTISNYDAVVDAFNVTTTDFLPTGTNINYAYTATYQAGGTGGNVIIPGKFGTPAQDEIHLDDGNGRRILLSNTDTSFVLTSVLTSDNDAVSPIIADSGLSLYGIEYVINDCELSNSLITLSNSGSGYGSSNTIVTFSAPTGKGGVRAQGIANVVNGIVDAVYITTSGKGYIETPTVTITAGAGAPNTAVAIVSGETSKSGGNAAARYVSKKVVLDQGFDSGDLTVYVTAYRPINTDIHVYYKILSRNDTQQFKDSSWQLMTKTNSCDAKYSQSREEFSEYTFAPGTSGTDQGYVEYTSSNGTTYNDFNQFAIKIVLTSSDKTYVPILKDMRTIALPSNVNTTF